MTNRFLDNTGLSHVLQSVKQDIADGAKSVFKTDSKWEAASLSVLQGWVTGATATDTKNNRTVNNYDVYLAKDSNAQYYFDSGAWVSFAPDLTDYFTKEQSDARYPTLADFADINLAASPVVIPSKLSVHRQIVESLLTVPIYGLITAVQSTTVSVQFVIGDNTGMATMLYDGAITTAKIGGLVRMDRKWERTVQSTTVTYILDIATSRCYPTGQQQSDWNETDSASPSFIKNKPSIPSGVAVVDHLNSTAANESLAANQGRVLKELIHEIEAQPLSTDDINSVLVAVGLPAV